MTNVNAHSLGIEGIEPETLRKTNVILIPRNTALPAKCTERFMTKSEGQQSIVVQVLEGESSLPGECTTIGRTVIRDLPAGLPKGWPVEVTFEYGGQWAAERRAVVPGTHHQAELALEREVGLSGDGHRPLEAVPISAAAGFGVFEGGCPRFVGRGDDAGSRGLIRHPRRGDRDRRRRRHGPAADAFGAPAAGRFAIALSDHLGAVPIAVAGRGHAGTETDGPAPRRRFCRRAPRPLRSCRRDGGLRRASPAARPARCWAISWPPRWAWGSAMFCCGGCAGPVSVAASRLCFSITEREIVGWVAAWKPHQ